MSHVDEGTLHAYIDGELPPNERTALEAHLAQCATCRATLAEERALLERASALLGSARPVERPAPPFEQLRRSQKRSPWHVRTSFAWAASIMLALGLGYYLRDPGNNTSALYAPSEPGFVAQNRDAAEPPPAPAAAPVPTLGREQQERRQPASTPPTDEVARLESRVDSAVAAETRRPRDSGAEAVALKSSTQLRNVAPATTAPKLMDTSLRLEAVVVTGAGAVDKDAGVAVRGRATTTTQWQIISRGTATTLLGTDPVGLPGLATRRIRRSPAPDATVVVEQVLDSSTVIQIFQRSADSPLYVVDGVPLQQSARAAREAAPAAAPARADRLARFVGRLRVEIAGPLSLDSLNRLLEEVQPLP